MSAVRRSIRLTVTPTGDGTVTVDIAAAAATGSLEQRLQCGDGVFDCIGSDGAGADDHFFGRGSDGDESDPGDGRLRGDGDGV